MIAVMASAKMADSLFQLPFRHGTNSAKSLRFQGVGEMACPAVSLESLEGMSMAAKNSDRQGPLSVVVSTLTRRRPEMLSGLLDSWSQLKLPENCEVTFLVVENDDQPRTQRLVEQYAERFTTSSLQYAFEDELGIPFGRNRAAKEAIAAGADLLAFVDDDEVVAEDWLVRFIAGYRQSEAVLLGGPVRVVPLDKSQNVSWLERLMHRSIVTRCTRKEKRAKQQASLNDTPRVTIGTFNWLGQTSLFTEHGLWFDEGMRHTGGTDAKFYTQTRDLGLTTGWVSDAYVYEEVPLDRLTFAYQFGRSRDHSNSYFRRKIARNPWARLIAFCLMPLKCVGILLLMILTPLTCGRTLLDLARGMGWVAGWTGAMFGKRSSHYLEVTGS